MSDASVLDRGPSDLPFVRFDLDKVALAGTDHNGLAGCHLLDSTKSPIDPAVTGVIVEEHHLRPDSNLQNLFSWELEGVLVPRSSGNELMSLSREPCQHRLVTGRRNAVRGC